MSGNSKTFLDFAPKFVFAIEEGLLSSADTYRDALSAKLANGYTTGHFTTGKAAESVKIRNPRVAQDGMGVDVYTTDFKQRMWEFGAFNAFTRQYERKEFWRETLEEQGPAMTQAFHKAFTQALGA